MRIKTVKIEELIRDEKLKLWSPVELAKVNDHVVRLVFCKGEYHWHKHFNEDELFFVVKRRLLIKMRKPYNDLTLDEGEMAVIPKGVEHCPISPKDSYILLFEPKKLMSEGDR